MKELYTDKNHIPTANKIAFVIVVWGLPVLVVAFVLSRVLP